MVDFNEIRKRRSEAPKPTPSLLVGITGHRPDKIGGYNPDNPIRRNVRAGIRAKTQDLINNPPDTDRATGNRLLIESAMRCVQWSATHIKEEWRSEPIIGISGCALGADQDAIEIWSAMQIPYIAAVPFPGQELVWPIQSQIKYRALLTKAAGVVFVHKTKPANYSEACAWLQERNDWIAFLCDELLAVWDGSSGGTANCVRDWRKMGKKEIIIHPTMVAYI